MERPDQRLDNTDRAVHCAGVAPGLELMLQRDMPMAECCRLVVVQAGMDAGFHPVERLAETESGRRRIGGIDAEHSQRGDLAAVHRLHETVHGAGAVRRLSGNRLGESQRRADAADVLVDEEPEHLRFRRMHRTDRHQRPARMVPQRGRRRFGPLPLPFGELGRSPGG